MYYRLRDGVALRKWKYLDRAIYEKGGSLAIGATKEEWEILLLCDGNHDIQDSPCLEGLLKKGLIERCEKG
nr:hypothetical protein [Bacilli bacterium]